MGRGYSQGVCAGVGVVGPTTPIDLERSLNGSTLYVFGDAGAFVADWHFEISPDGTHWLASADKFNGQVFGTGPNGVFHPIGSAAAARIVVDVYTSGEITAILFFDD